MIRRAWNFLTLVVNRTVVVAGGIALSLIFFMILPLMQSISVKSDDLYAVRDVETFAAEPPPPPPVEEEPEEPDEPEEPEPPQLSEDVPPLDLSQLEMALNPGFGAGYGAGAMAVDLGSAIGGKKDVAELFSAADLDQQPRPVYQPGPNMTPDMKRKAPGQVYVIFIVDEQGRVQNPKVQRSSDPIFERAALTAVRQWKFEPGKREGRPVRFRMRVPLTFPRD